jgi:REP element-mobilizing transposase RayT
MWFLVAMTASFYWRLRRRRFCSSKLRRYEALHGVHVVTFCIMTNHFHLLVEIPPRSTSAGPMFTEESFLVQLENSLGHGKVEELRRLFEMYRGNGCEKLILEVIAGYEKRISMLASLCRT